MQIDEWVGAFGSPSRLFWVLYSTVQYTTLVLDSMDTTLFPTEMNCQNRTDHDEERLALQNVCGHPASFF